MSKQEIIDEILNFIEYYTSNDDLRMKMILALKDYEEECLSGSYDLEVRISKGEYNSLTSSVMRGDFNTHPCGEIIYKVINGITREVNNG
jgi:hypothetical protein